MKTRQWWSPDQLAEHYGLSAAYFRKLIRAGTLTGMVRPYRVADVDRQMWEQSKMNQTPLATAAAGETKESKQPRNELERLADSYFGK